MNFRYSNNILIPSVVCLAHLGWQCAHNEIWVRGAGLSSMISAWSRLCPSCGYWHALSPLLWRYLGRLENCWTLRGKTSHPLLCKCKGVNFVQSSVSALCTMAAEMACGREDFGHNTRPARRRNTRLCTYTCHLLHTLWIRSVISANRGDWTVNARDSRPRNCNQCAMNMSTTGHAWSATYEIYIAHWLTHPMVLQGCGVWLYQDLPSGLKLIQCFGWEGYRWASAYNEPEVQCFTWGLGCTLRM